MNLIDYKKLFLDFLQSKQFVRSPKNLYVPVDYILQLGGKRLRPIFVLLSVEAFGEETNKGLNAALAIEVFHNFTLLHDDIMDKAPVRRGQPSVHEKWDISTGVLSGDVMMINAYQYLEVYTSKIYKDLNTLFSKTAVEVCEGQQYDMDFETQIDVDMAEYLKMIKLKTSVLLAAALQMGAIIAQASSDDQETIYNFGIAAGMAFQLQDDYLDTFGSSETFGKQIGGDILERKKTWLYIKTIEKASEHDKDILLDIYDMAKPQNPEAVHLVKTMFKKYKVDRLIIEEIHLFSEKALKILSGLKLTKQPTIILEELVHSLKNRTS